MIMQSTNLLGFPSQKSDPAIKEYPAVQDALLNTLVRVPDVLLLGSPTLKALKQVVEEEREREVIEALPGIFSRNGWPTGANMMHYWLHGRSFDGRRGWDYEKGETKGVLLEDAEVASLIDKHQRLKDALRKLHKRFLEPNSLLKEFFSRPVYASAPTDLEKAKLRLYNRYTKLSPGTKEQLHWGTKVEYPEFYLTKEEVGYLRQLGRDSHYYPVYFDDLSVSLGRFGLRAYASGELIKEAQTGSFKVSAIGFRIFDEFSFQKKCLSLLSQPLGNWSTKGPESFFSTKGIYLNDASFVRYKELYHKGTDFLVYSRMYTFSEISRLCTSLDLTSPPAFSISLSGEDGLQPAYDFYPGPKF